MNKLDLFEKMIKDSAEAHEMPYDYGAWSQMNSKLDASSVTGSGSGSAGLNTLAACLSGLIIVGGLATLGTSLKNSPQTERANHTYYSVGSDADQAKNSQETTLALTDVSHPVKEIEVKEDESIPAQHISKMEQSSIVVYDKNTHEETIVEVDKLKDEVEREKSKEVSRIESSVEEKFKSDYVDTETVVETESVKLELQNFIPLPTNAVPCEGEKVEFDVLMYNDKQTTEWDFGDGYISSSRNPVHAYEKAGDYVVTLTTKFKDGAKGTTEKSQEIAIKVMAAPKVDFTVNTSDFAARPVTTLKSRNDQNMSVWQISNGEKFSGDFVETIFNKKGSKTITLTETADNGCEASKSKTIYIENDYNLLTPNALTCNGDGHNDDNWFPKALEVLNFPFELVVMDKSGKTVYTTRTVKPWNGINNMTGENCPTGFYVWYVKLTNDKNQIEEYKGSFYLNRN